MLPRGGLGCTLPGNVGLPVSHERRGGVSLDICKFIAQGTGQLYATASHRLDAVANIESIYRFFKKFRTFFTAQFLVFGYQSRRRFFSKNSARRVKNNNEKRASCVMPHQKTVNFE